MSQVLLSPMSVEEFLNALRAERGMSVHTVEAYRRDLAQYMTHLDGVPPSPEMVGSFVSTMADLGMAESSIGRKLAAVRSLHRFLVEEGEAASDPTATIRPPRRLDSVPKALDVDETIALVSSPDPDTVGGVRDRALLEVLYATGCRVSEATGLDLSDIDLNEGIACVTGKGDRERRVPLGRHAVSAVSRWLPVRLEVPARCDAVFTNLRGGRLSRQGVFRLVRINAVRAGLDPERVSPHVLRHSVATHMIEAGADLRVVQELLGHANVRTTQVYTRVSAHHLREIYLEAHPRSR